MASSRLLPLLWFFAVSALAQPPEAIHYTLRFPAPQTHYVDVEALIPTPQQASVELMMPVWTPGSYLVREYSRNVEAFSAHSPSGLSLHWEKTRKNRWRVHTNGSSAVKISYRVYGREMTVRNNWIERDFAILNGAPTFLTVADQPHRPHEIKVEPPPAWKVLISALPGASPNTFLAPDFDTLVDSPLYAGNANVAEFTVAGKKHYLVSEGGGKVWDNQKAAADVAKIVTEYSRMWGPLPYEKYVFFNMLTGGGGGLEHKNSTVMMTSRWATRTPVNYRRWLGLASHEYFHLWNVKRLRPIELGPFDYENEVYSRSLWVGEGFTSYYGPLGARRAGVTTNDDLLQSLSTTIGQLQATPGRFQTPVETASFDSWIKLYRPDENSANTTISYYTKGAVIGFLLDAKIRKATKGARSLDDLMRLGFERYGGARGYTPAEFRKLASDTAGLDLDSWWRHVLETTEELDYTEALEWYGLRFHVEADRGPAKAWLGATTRNDAGRLVVTEVRRLTPAYDAGLSVDDEILGIDDYRVRADQFDTRLGDYKPGETVSLLIARREQFMRLEVTFGKEPPRRWTLEIDPKATDPQKKNFKAWVEAH